MQNSSPHYRATQPNSGPGRNGSGTGSLEDMMANLLALAVAIAALALVVAHFWRQPWTPMRIAGAAIGLPSLALFVLARVQLGGSFSVHAKAQALVTGGLYSRIRNPIYVFGGLMLAGI